jgi:aryl-alcohol dehydrogenase-like predicted oxidoreductase
MDLRTLGTTDLRIAPLVLGGNVFGWTADEETSFRILDAMLDHGLNAVDTADVYSAWADGHEGGESETVIGNWLTERGPEVRDRVVLITKVGHQGGLSRDHILEAAEASLRRLRTDRIDLYFSHKPDPETPIEETLEAHQRLIEQGKIRWAGASNYDAEQLAAALEAGRATERARYAVLQPEYNLYARSDYEGGLWAVAERADLGVIPYFALGAGFLTGKYRSEEDFEKGARGAGVKKRYWNDRGRRILAALDEVAESTDATPAQVALAWLMARPTVTAPIASATSVEQLAELAEACELELDEAAMGRLDEVSRTLE